MIHKLTNRSHLRASSWLAEVFTLDWRNIQRPPREGMGIQASDLVRNIDGDAVAHRIQDAFLEIAERAATPSERVESDGHMAEFVHKALDGMTLREASDADFWAYIVTYGCPQYPRWRWPGPRADLKNRYAGGIRDNAFAALWWWAEATHDSDRPLDDPNRYSETRIVSGRTSFVLYCVDCAFAGRKDLVRKLCDIQRREQLGDLPCKKLGRSVNRMARVACLDSLRDQNEVIQFSERAYQVSRQLR